MSQLAPVPNLSKLWGTGKKVMLIRPELLNLNQYSLGRYSYRDKGRIGEIVFESDTIFSIRWDGEGWTDDNLNKRAFRLLSDTESTLIAMGYKPRL